jgi:hypothetical protein
MKKNRDTTPMRGISLRVDESKLSQFEITMKEAGLTVSEALRFYMDHSLAAISGTDLEGLRFETRFTPKLRAEGVDRFPELVGSLIMKVTPPPSLSNERLHQLIFIIPEFSKDNDEPFRVDSAYFQRVAAGGKYIESETTKRNVLSFRLIEGMWRASVFNYSSAEIKEIESVVVEAIKTHITRTIQLDLAGQLPLYRYLSLEEVSEMNEIMMHT